MSANKFECYHAQITINKVNKVEIGFCPIVRIPIRSQQEAEAYMQQGVAIYEKTTKTSRGVTQHYFVEVNLYDLAKVARKD